MAIQYDILADASLGMPPTISLPAAVGARDYFHWINANLQPVRTHVAHATVYTVVATNGSVGVLGCEIVSRPPPPPPP